MRVSGNSKGISPNFIKKKRRLIANTSGVDSIPRRLIKEYNKKLENITSSGSDLKTYVLDLMKLK